MAARRSATVAVLIVALLSLALPAQAARPAAQRPGAEGWAARQIRSVSLPARDRDVAAGLPGRARVGYHPATRRVRFLSGTPNIPLARRPAGVAGSGDVSAADAKRLARGFMVRYGGLFGLAAPGRELRVRSARKQGLASTSGRVGPAGTEAPRDTIVRFDQVRSGLPVMGGEIVVQVAADGAVLSAAGEVLPSAVAASARPRIPAWRAIGIARTWLGRESGLPISRVRVRSEGLALYDARIMGDPSTPARGPQLVWRLDARVAATPATPEVHRLILVDARSGVVVSSIGRLQDANRLICDNRNVAGRSYLCRRPFTRIEGQSVSGIRDVDVLYRLMGVVRDYLSTTFGRDGIDGQGSRMKATVRYCPGYGCPWRNAQWHWDTQQAVFGRGWSRADDIVAHEFAHGVLDAETPFFYHYQSGAINESYADVFGELIDLSYPGGRDTAFTRWKIGEDTPRGAFRDMRDPTRFGHPDRVRSRLWHSGSGDDGGVHRNSGVGNKAAYLIADGGSFRGYDIAGVGRVRAARIYYQALTSRLTSAADYIDLADALVAACTDLAGTQGIRIGDCQSVRQATIATQMHLRPRVLPPRSAPICGRGKAPLDVFADDLENPGAGLWQTVRLVGKQRGWYYPQNPNNVPSWDGTWASSGELNFYAPDRGARSDTVMKLKGALRLPPGTGAFLRFEHGYAFDRDRKRRYDGGVVEIKVDGGPWRGVTALFTHGGYDGRIARGRGNPLAGRRAFTGYSRGWASARVNLEPFAGRTIRLRFRMASDRRVGGTGWYIDDVRVYVCSADGRPPTGSVEIAGGADATADPEVQLAFTSSDADTWVTRLRVSNSPALNPNGTLRNGLSMPIRDELGWDLTESAWGGGPALGTRRVYAQVRDAAGNWSAVFSDDIELTAAP